MKRLLQSALILILFVSIAAQEIQHEAVAVNIEVPVRVYDGDTFIDNLILSDFEVYEDGVLQKTEAMYLVKKTIIQEEDAELPRVEARKIFTPKTSRRFVLVFEVQDWMPELNKVIDAFFEDVVAPGDSLIVMTPVKTYNMNSEALEKLPKEVCAEQLKSKLRKDVITGNSLYNSIMRELIGILGGNSMMGEASLHDLYQEWKNLKYVEEKNLLNFAEYLKSLDGQKHVFLFYQKEVLPQYSVNQMQRIQRMSQDNPQRYHILSDLFEFFKRDINFDLEKIKAAFSDSSITNHFLYLTWTKQYSLDVRQMIATTENVRMVEKSENIFSAFKELADATGGIAESSQNPSFLFKRAADASENYYLLYYTPKDYKSDGMFRNIKVKIKGKSYKVLHRAGYLAD